MGAGDPGPLVPGLSHGSLGQGRDGWSGLRAPVCAKLHQASCGCSATRLLSALRPWFGAGPVRCLLTPVN